jgi:RHS repeat-associated protein
VYPGGKVLAAGYTARGQLATMTFHGQPVATSTYRPNGQPIGTVYGNGAQRTLSYDAAGRLTGTGTNVGAATITGRGYALDAVGRRTGYVDETAANAVFTYDPAGQVLGGTVPVPGQPASVNTYAYDPEGNRTQSSTGIQPAPAAPVTITGSTTYTANPLNQYTAITGNPNPTYDADGNLLSGLRSPLSVFTSTWNGENRMLSSTSANVAITDRRVEHAYDALGRRVRKTVKFASTGAVIEDRYFTYDGWNVIEETIAPATGPVETAEAVWGTDLSGSAQGAGGVGGLLLRESSANGASYYHYDGNGNVTALTSAAGVVQAAYTYGPFGETLRAAGPLAQANPWRFSTKYQDDETGLLYYGYRFYNPTDGRWPNRDPIQERGGDNLYGFCFNNGNAWIDILGREPGWPMGLVWQNGQMTYDPYSNPLHNFTPPAWQRSADGEVTVNKCHIVIFLGHNNSVPQGKIRNAPCSAAHVISCGGAGVYNPGQPEIPIPGAPGNLKSKDNDAISLEIAKRMLVRSLNAAKKMANTICGDKMKCCTEVAIDVESSLGFVSRGLFPGGSGPWHIVIPCKR